MRVTKESQLLDPAVRAKIIEEIEGPENKRRKNEHYKRYQCYKDQTYIQVIKQLLKQFDSTTVNEMSYAISNIAIVRKVIDKLARVYKYGVTREALINDKKDEKTTETLKELTNKLDFNSAMKKTNRFFKLHKNTAVYVCPKKISLDDNAKKTIKVLPLQPFLYDVVEMAEAREKPACFILSDYEVEDTTGMLYSVNPAATQRTQRSIINIQNGDGVDQTIADTPSDQKDYSKERVKYYVFWSTNYHFTCDSKGAIVSDGDSLNPIGELPFRNFAEDQDGAFWAIGGDDLTDGAILVNSLISNINHIAITQGYGQLVMTGKNLPRNLKSGPNKVVLLEYEGGPDAAVPTFDFKTANPPLDQLRSLIEMYVALLLTTNNLTTTGVASNLNDRTQYASGIAMLIDKSESMEDVEDQRQIFIDNEPEIWELIAKWHQTLTNSGELDDDLRQYTFTPDFKLSLKFEHPEVIQTETDQLNALKLKKDLGIISLQDMMKQEYPELTDGEIDEKIKAITAQKMENMNNVLNQSIGGQNNQVGDQQQPGAGPPPPAQNGPGANQG